MKVLIIEDEKLAANRLSKLLEQISNEIEVIGMLDTVESSVQFLKETPQPDLIFLDIQLGDGKSFEIFSKVKVNSHIIFTTAFDEYALKAYKYNSIDYLLKPLNKDEISFAINKYKNLAQPKTDQFDFENLLSRVKQHGREFKGRFLVKRGQRLLSVTTDDVAIIFTREKIHYLKTFDETEYIIGSNLDELEVQLDPSMFFRANRQFIINYKAINSVFSWFDGKLKLALKPASYEEIIISRLKASEFKKWMSK